VSLAFDAISWINSRSSASSSWCMWPPLAIAGA
jgi:hypothetical protein